MTADGSPAAVDVAICTFRRPQVADTLRSVAACRRPAGLALRVIVVDNDDEPTARLVAVEAATRAGVSLSYVHAPGRNISIARNAALDAAEARLFAFIDDDETASDGWLDALVGEWRRTRSAVVLGPVDAVYPPGVPDWMAEAAPHSTRPVFVDGRIVTGYSGNALLDLAAPSVAGRRFSLALGRTGGEDTDFFHRIHEAGGSIAYAADATATEPVPPGRASFGWLVRRRYVHGQAHARILRERHPGTAGRIREAARAAGKAGACLAGAAASVARPASARGWILRGALHVGVAASLLGGRDRQSYGQIEGADPLAP